MQICLKALPTVRFGDIPSVTVIQHSKRFFLKTELDGFGNVVDLQTGRISMIDKDIRVIAYPDAKLELGEHIKQGVDIS